MKCMNCQNEAVWTQTYKPRGSLRYYCQSCAEKFDSFALQFGTRSGPFHSSAPEWSWSPYMEFTVETAVVQTKPVVMKSRYVIDAPPRVNVPIAESYGDIAKRLREIQGEKT